MVFGKENDMPLPTPVGRQREVLYLPAEGHVAVLGTAGSGKTTLAILRAAYLAQPDTTNHGRTLLVTFNRTLVAYLKHLQPSAPVDLVVEHYHRFARGYLAAQGLLTGFGGIADDRDRNALIGRAVESVVTGGSLSRKSATFFGEELQWIARHGLSAVEEYLLVDRVGRGAPLGRSDRTTVFRVFLEYRRLRQAAGFSYDWDDIAIVVRDQLRADSSPRRYRHVVIDEGQDFSPVMLQSLVQAVQPGGSLTFFGDMAQQIYGASLSWRAAGLHLVAAPWVFKENYRNTRPIAALALAVAHMPYYEGTPDLVEPNEPAADGPPATLVVCRSAADELQLLGEQVRAASDDGSVAVIVKDHASARRVVRALPPGSIALTETTAVWPGTDSVYYGTYNAAKGLEFDSVFLPFLSEGLFPDANDSERYGDTTSARWGKLLYVGITRARVRLVMTAVAQASSLLPQPEGLYAVLRR